MFDVAENIHSIMDDKIQIKKEYVIFFYDHISYMTNISKILHTLFFMTDDDDQTTCKFLN
jgi:hypothetical protein